MTTSPSNAIGCAFCTPPADRIVLENDLAYALRDAYPVTSLHTLVIPRRHIPDYFELSSEELAACNDLLRRVRAETITADPTVKGFNIGVNVGSLAGQTIFHCHVHLIPRRQGDVENPRGGVRHTIPGKGNY